MNKGRKYKNYIMKSVWYGKICVITDSFGRRYITKDFNRFVRIK